MMSGVDEIVAAARRLPVAQFHSLRRKLDRVEEQLWKTEQARASASLRQRGITDKDIDRMVLRRRRESRR
ncbi:MAG TPA: hypothetical protein VGG61_15635 [Gemmataceae bacterium]|jgi:hypothetical protein